MAKLGQAVRSCVKDLSLISGVYQGTFFGVYPFGLEPRHLLFVVECLKSVSSVPGSCVEAGCSFGATTVFLNKIIQDEGVPRTYYAIDTFSGFVPEQARHEIEFRSKPKLLHDSFSDNKKRWFDKSMRMAGLSNVRSIEADVTTVDFTAFAPIAFCLVDVDLYLPIRDVLPKVSSFMAKGGIVIVDDCVSGLWDGALQAYEEFVAERDIAPEIAAGRLGVLRF
jgi:O-methyltransferase